VPQAGLLMTPSLIGKGSGERGRSLIPDTALARWEARLAAKRQRMGAHDPGVRPTRGIPRVPTERRTMGTHSIRLGAVVGDIAVVALALLPGAARATISPDLRGLGRRVFGGVDRGQVRRNCERRRWRHGVVERRRHPPSAHRGLLRPAWLRDHGRRLDRARDERWGHRQRLIHVRLDHTRAPGARLRPAGLPRRRPLGDERGQRRLQRRPGPLPGVPRQLCHRLRVRWPRSGGRHPRHAQLLSAARCERGSPRAPARVGSDWARRNTRPSSSRVPAARA
jgi:hypothetical protein